MKTITLSISGMSCGHCVAAVRAALDAVPGAQVQDVRVGSATVAVDGEGPAALIAAVEDAGYDATLGAASATAADAGPAPLALRRAAREERP